LQRQHVAGSDDEVSHPVILIRPLPAARSFRQRCPVRRGG
jgi:hypothetical protein